MLENIRKSLSKVGAAAMTGILCFSLAACGGGGGSAGSNPNQPTTNTPKAAALNLVFSTGSIPSSGTASSNVTVTVTATDANNNVVSGVPVQFSVNSGTIAVTNATTNSAGQSVATLAIGSDKSNRTITVTAKSGTITATQSINVVGTKITANASGASVAFGATEIITIVLTDSAGQPVASAPVTVSSQAGNAITPTKFSGTASNPLTGTDGSITVNVTGSKSDTITVSALGASTTTSFTVASATLNMAIVDPATGQAPSAAYVSGPGISSGSCLQVNANYQVNGTPTAGSLALSTTRGALYSDSACTQSFGGVVTLNAQGNMTSNVYVASQTAGPANVTGLIAQTSGGPLTQTATVAFSAQVSGTSQISLQPAPSTVSANTDPNNPTQYLSVLRATVRDGSNFHNVISNAQVAFSIANDVSGGSLATPSIATTGLDGNASVNFYPGPNGTAGAGVTIVATLLGADGTPLKRADGTVISTTATLTVSHVSLHITAGTGNTVNSESATTYSQDWSVYVSDASGNPVQNAVIVANATTPYYLKGNLVFTGIIWAVDPKSVPASGWCPSNDKDNSGIYVPASNGNQNDDIIYYSVAGQANQPDTTKPYRVLVPNLPLSVTVGGTTDATGYTTVKLRWPKDHTLWTQAQLSFTTTVAGSQATYTTTPFVLIGSTQDYTQQTTSPPGVVSPYGIHDCDIYN